MSPRTLPRRSAYPRAGSSWVYPPNYARAARELPDIAAKVDVLLATVTESGVDPDALAAVGETLAEVRARLDDMGAQVEQVDSKVTSVDGRVDTAAAATNDLRADLTAEAQARAGGDQNTMGVANAARSMARDARDTTASLSSAVATDKAALPATVQDMIAAATQQVLAPALAGADQAHAHLQTEVDALTARLAELSAQIAAIPAGPPGARGPTGAAGPAGADSTVPGPQGVPGKDGRDGAASTVPGPRGAAGADSTVPGPAGKDGTVGAPGKDGAAGKDGSVGPRGADSTVPGPTGPAGKDGSPGAAGPTGPAGPAGKDGGIPAVTCGVASLPVLAASTPKDVDVPWTPAPTQAPLSAVVSAVEGVTLSGATVKQVTATKAVVTVTAPAAVAANLGRVRVVGVGWA